MFSPSTTIDDLRGVGRVELEFDERQSAYVLIGSNGVGKTKTLEALFQIAFFASSRVRMHNTPVRESVPVFKSASLGEQKLVVSQKYTSPDRILNIELHGSPVVYAGSQSRGFFVSGRYGPKALGTFAERQTRYVQSVISGMQSNFSALNMEANVDRWFVERAQSQNPYQLSDDNRGFEIRTVLTLLNHIDQRIDPNFLEISGNETASLKIADEHRQLNELSTGFAAVVKLIQTIVAGYAAFTNDTQLQQVEGFVFIDEIESHLHVTWQSHIVRLLVELFPNTTFFVTTHSPIVIAQCQPGEAYQLSRDKHGVVRNQRIEAPGRMALVDLLDEAFGVDVNQMKLEQMSPDLQSQGKSRLLDLLRDGDA